MFAIQNKIIKLVMINETGKNMLQDKILFKKNVWSRSEESFL